MELWREKNGGTEIEEFLNVKNSILHFMAI